LKSRVCAVSYLNTTPLVWGLLHGPQKGTLDLRFEIPSRCADLLRDGEVDIGIVPVIELDRQPLEIIPGLGITSDGPVRSILLASKVEPDKIRTLAADKSSRTSVVLSRILLGERFGAKPKVTAAAPDFTGMLDSADAALVIGDPALTLPTDPRAEHLLDLGSEWTAWTGLPMVYAVWAARAGFDWQDAATILSESFAFGRSRTAEIARAEAAPRGLTQELACEYLARNIQFELTPRHLDGLALFRRLAREMNFV
jgi:chorismate dehydratase